LRAAFPPPAYTGSHAKQAGIAQASGEFHRDATALRDFSNETVIDGELVALGPDGLRNDPDFGFRVKKALRLGECITVLPFSPIHVP